MGEERSMFGMFKSNYMVCPQCSNCCKLFVDQFSSYPYVCQHNTSECASYRAYSTTSATEKKPGIVCPTIASCKAFEAKAGGSDGDDGEGFRDDGTDDDPSESEDYEPKRRSTEELMDAVGDFITASKEKLRQKLQSSESEEECLAEVTGPRGAGIRLKHVPEYLKTPRLCLAAVTNYGGALEYVPEHLKTLELCQAAVSEYSGAIMFVPEDVKTLELCMTAVTNYGGALEYVPEHIITPELCLTAIVENASAFTFVPENFMTPEFCITAVSNNGQVLGSVPKNLRTSEICMAAVSNEGNALGFVPENLITSEICMAAVSSNGKTLFRVPEDLMTMELCMAAVSNEGSALQYVPKNLRTMEICMAAASNDESALQYVPEKIKPRLMYRILYRKISRQWKSVVSLLSLLFKTALRLGTMLREKMKKRGVYLKSSPPTKGKSYAFLIFTGFIGGHRFYLGKFKTGILFVLLFVLGISEFPITFIPLIIWLIIDCFTLGRQIKKIQECYKAN